MDQYPSSPGGATLAAFSGAVLIGGANFIAVRFSNEELDPLFGAALRFGLATLLFLLIARVTGAPFPRGRATAGAALYGLLGFGAAYGLLYYALVGLTAGTTSVITAAAPLVTLVLAVLHGQERFSTRGVVGGGLAIAGLVVLSAGNLGGDLRPAYLIAAMLGVVAIGGSSVVVKDFPKAHPVTTNAVGMATGTAFLIVTSIAFQEQWAFPREGRTWLALSWLVILGSVALFLLFLFVIKRWTASASVYAITMMPVVAVTLGALIVDEPITAEVLAGGALVIAAVYVGAISGTRKPREVRPPEPLAAAAEVAPEGRP